MLLFRNCSKEPHSLFFAESVDVEGQCVAFASLPHLCVFGVECREIASVKFSVRVKAYGRKDVYLLINRDLYVTIDISLASINCNSTSL